jgi:hypothetical protein
MAELHYQLVEYLRMYHARGNNNEDAEVGNHNSDNTREAGSSVGAATSSSDEGFFSHESDDDVDGSSSNSADSQLDARFNSPAGSNAQTITPQKRTSKTPNSSSKKKKSLPKKEKIHLTSMGISYYRTYHHSPRNVHRSAPLT